MVGIEEEVNRVNAVLDVEKHCIFVGFEKQIKMLPKACPDGPSSPRPGSRLPGWIYFTLKNLWGK
jgi:hypothetical protein